MKVAIIGVGLIGGSIALALRASGFASEITGIDSDQKNLIKAKELGIIDFFGDLNNSLREANLVIIAIPVSATCKILPEILDNIGPETIVTDMGSTKNLICQSVENHPYRNQFVASHPIAGTEHSGPEAAFKELFYDKVSIICNREKSSEKALSLVEKMYRSVRMKLVYMEAFSHDLHVAYVSHLSHISSFALGITVLEIEKNEATIFNLAGSGFESTVRLAKSSPDMWNPIFQQNSKFLSSALGEYIKTLETFKNYIDNQEFDKTYQLMESANEIRRVLDGMNNKKV